MGVIHYSKSNRIFTQRSSAFTSFSMRLLLILSGLIVSLPSQADTLLGIYAGYHFWDSQFDGNFNTVNQSQIDIENELGFDSDSANSIYIALEHPIPFLPNIKLSRTSIDVTATSNLTQSITFQNEPFAANATISSQIDLSFNDATFYYEILDNWVSLDLGLSIRQFDGIFAITSGAQSANASFDEAIPMLYAAAQFDLPFTGFYGRVSGNGLAIDDHSHTDITAVVGYEAPLRWGAELGYRNMTLKFDELSANNLAVNSDLTIGGIFMGLTLHI